MLEATQTEPGKIRVYRMTHIPLFDGKFQITLDGTEGNAAAPGLLITMQ